MITVFKYLINKIERIGLCWENEKDYTDSIKELPSVVYCKETGSWHIEKSLSVYRAFVYLGIPYRVDKSSDTIDTLRSRQAEVANDDNVDIGSEEPNSVVRPKEVGADILSERKDLSIKMQGECFVIDMKYDESNVAFVKSLRRSYWHSTNRVWLAKATVENLELLQERFGAWGKSSYEKIEKLLKMQEDPICVELFQSPEYPQRVLVKLRGYGVDVAFLKQMPARNYDKEFKRWMIPKDDKMIARITAHYERSGAKVINRIAKTGMSYKRRDYSLRERQTYLLNKMPVRHRRLLEEYTESMIRQKYSWQTIKSYAGSFLKFIQFNEPKPVQELSEQEVNKYVAEIVFQNVSESMINKVISSIKFYYERVAFRLDFELERIERPRKGRRLPTILSIQEIDRLLRSLENLKHVTLLYTLYSSGLRLSEVLSLRLSDLSFDRNQMLVVGGKGKKDRMVMLSERLKQMLQLYIDSYQPIYWVFEGRDRQSQYSTRSVQSVVKLAARKADINKRVTPHTLRHCFATHLLDGGTNVCYIQELLGHKDIKTTLIYTHVTTEQALSVKSPLDQLDISLNQARSK